MNKTELVTAVAERAEISKKDADKAVKAVFNLIEEALVKGDKVQLIGFGTFEVRERSARKGRNPITGEELMIEAKKSASLKISKPLREKINS